MAKWTQEDINNEIKRKAQQGIALADPTEDKQKLYDQYRNEFQQSQQPKQNSNISNQMPQTVNNANSYADQMKSYVNSMYDNQQKSQLAQLQAQRDKAIGGLNQQKSQLAPQYQGLRNQADVTNMQNVQRLREAMANEGLTASGENVTAMTGLAGQRQGALDSLNLQQQQETNDINRRIGDLNNPNDVVALTSAINSERNRALLGAYQNAVARGDQLTQQQIDNAFRNNQFMFDVDSSMWNRRMQESQFDFTREQAGIDNAYRQQQAQQQAKQFAQQMGLNYDQLDQNQQQFLLEYAQRQAQIDASQQQPQQSQQQVNEAMSQAMKLAQNDPRLQQGTYSTEPIDGDIIQQVIAEYYQQLTGQKPTQQDISGFMNYLGGFSQYGGNNPVVSDEETYNFLKDGGYIQ